MPFRSNLNLNAKIFDPAERKRAFGSVPRAAAKEFKNDLRQAMETGPHTGKVVSRGKRRGNGFTRRHQQSRRGERPAPDTRGLINSIADSRTSDLSAKVEVEAERGAILQERQGRDVMTSQDISKANESYKKRGENKLSELLS